MNHNKLFRNARLVVIIAAILCVAYAYSQDPPKPPVQFPPSEIQSLRLQVKQRDARLAQLASERAMGDLAVECHKVRDDNKWPATVECDFNTLTFIDMKPPTVAAKPEAPKPEPPKAEPKKKK